MLYFLLLYFFIFTKKRNCLPLLLVAEYADILVEYMLKQETGMGVVLNFFSDLFVSPLDMIL